MVSPTANCCPGVGLWIVGTGGVLPTSMRTLAGDEVAPWLSVTVSVAVNVPAVVYVCAVVATAVCAGAEPSPKLHVYVRVSPASGSLLADALNDTATGALALEVGEAVRSAGWGRVPAAERGRPTGHPPAHRA